jgi:putative endonuclease
MKQPAIYIVANRKNGALYTGVTSDLLQRIAQHKAREIEGFSKKYDCKMLVLYELHETMESAILREKQIKGGSRSSKIKLIEKNNFSWQDLFTDLL